MALSYSEFADDALSQLTCCQRACPVETDVSSYLAFIAAGRMDEALAVVREVNPFPSVCGRVCDHACETNCRRAESDQPVAIRALKRYLADRERKQFVDWPPAIAPTRQEKVAIIGSGPAGLTAASDLVRRGFPVTVFEALPRAGGMMRVGIPEYRLPAEVLDFDIEYQLRLGVELKVNAALGRDFTLADLREQGYHAVLLATGAHGSRDLNIPGAELPGISSGIAMLRGVKLDEAPAIGKRVIVIGGGDVAMDTARTALRLGAESVDLFCLEAREQMPAHDWEMLEALDEKIRFHCGWGPAEFTGTDHVTGATFVACTALFDANGRFAPSYDEQVRMSIAADTVYVAIGQYAIFAHGAEDGVSVTPRQLYQVDATTLQTTLPWVFAAGDAATGPANVVKAIASGHRAAAAMTEYLSAQSLTGHWQPLPHVERAERAEIPSDWEERSVALEEELPVCARINDFVEVKITLNDAAARREAVRCMRCDSPTKSASYTRLAREQIYHLARDLRQEDERLAFLQRRLLENSARRSPAQRAAALDDLIFLPANLTRLVIDPYREPCATAVVIGANAASPLKLAAPVLIGGLPFERMGSEVFSAFCDGAVRAGSGIRLPIGLEWMAGDAQVISVVPLARCPVAMSKVSAVELLPDHLCGVIDAELLRAAVAAYRLRVPGVPVGLALTADHLKENLSSALDVALDFVTLSAMPAATAWQDEVGLPDISVLAEAMETLRALNREEDIDLLYFGGLRSGTDVARAVALGAKAGIIGCAAGLAASTNFQQTPEAAAVAARVANLLQSMRMESAVLARCCGKTDVMNLEPEDLRSLTVPTAQASGIPLVGNDRQYRG